MLLLVLMNREKFLMFWFLSRVENILSWLKFGKGSSTTSCDINTESGITPEDVSTFQKSCLRFCTTTKDYLLVSLDILLLAKYTDRSDLQLYWLANKTNLPAQPRAVSLDLIR